MKAMGLSHHVYLSDISHYRTVCLHFHESVFRKEIIGFIATKEKVKLEMKQAVIKIT
jgi:hypothetical protein